MRGLLAARASPDAPPTPEEGVNLASIAAQVVQSRLARLPTEQLSQDPADLAGLLSLFEDGLDGYPNDARPRLIRVLRGLAESDDDVQGALKDLRSLCGAGFTVDFTGGTRAVKAAEAEIEALRLRLYPEGGGLQGLIPNQVGEFALAGASSLEWVPSRNRRGIERVAVVPAEEIRIRRDLTTRQLIYQQWGYGSTVTLDPLTYRHVALVTAGRRPHGIPLFIAALASLERKRQLLVAEQRVINLMARSALVQAKIDQPTPEQLGLRGVTISDPRYMQAVVAFYNAAADLIAGSSESGIYVGTKGTEITVLPISQNAAGAPEVTRGNQHRVWNALGTQPFLRGEMDSTTQALAQVTIPLVYAQAVMIDGGVSQALEFGFNLHLRLAGIPAQASVKFTPPQSPFQLDEATALLRRAEAHERLAALFGPAWAQAAMREFDIAENDDKRAPKWWNPSPPPSTPASGGPTP
ncbi:hypothetical protein MF271_19410 (plasmid) [Deinococcus sp. KNUC1210]|uniref:hypothetical protein n=1 Tax=Deinococcus sp. KNUC1210 TaxID=2917691 RepID=UPI001EEFE865|nr:hypothetical protein [Deinococcus sp. KNUC1210]ULH17360.1 hypothetical protein MF271_19410 [Deinococcus sp. KNUC1210]